LHDAPDGGAVRDLRVVDDGEEAAPREFSKC
jgi:hypothetical protein